MKAQTANKRDIFFIKETSDNYKIDINKLTPITRMQMEKLCKQTKNTNKKKTKK